MADFQRGGASSLGLLAPTDLTRWPRHLLRRLDRLLAGRRWIVIVVGLAFAISVVTAWPTYTTYYPKGEDWTALQHKAEYLFEQPWGPKDHPFDSTYRLTVPVVGGLLGLGPNGYLVLHALAGLCLFAAAAHLVERITADRRLAALVAISTGLMWSGACAFVEVRPNFDAVAIAFLLAAMATRRVPLVILCGFLAGWTDERALPALAFVALLHHVVEDRELGVRSAVREPRVLATAAAVALVIASRLAVQQIFDLDELSQFGGAGFISDQIGIWPLGAWTGLEGFWILLALATVALFRAGQRLLAVAYAGLAVAITILSIAVVDVTRTMAYLLPAGLAGLAIAHRLCTPKLFRYAIYATFTATLLWPLYYAGGSKTVYWQYPLPLVVIGRLAGVS